MYVMKTVSEKIHGTLLTVFVVFTLTVAFSIMCCGCSGSMEERTETGSVRTGSGTGSESYNEATVYLYFAERNRPYLKTEERILPAPGDPVEFGRIVIEALLKGPTRGLRRTVSSDTVLRALYITKDKTVYADFSKDISESHPGGSQSEYLTIYSIVNSLILNIPEIEQVKLLIEGQEEVTLAGHIDIRLPLKANMLLVR